MTQLALIAFLFYSCTVFYLAWRIKSSQAAVRCMVFLLGFAAVISHGYVLHLWIDVQQQQNLSFFNMLSLVAWLNAVLILLLGLRRPTENLLLIAAPIAALSIVLVSLFPAQYLIDTGAHPSQLIHILLSVLAFSVLCIAAFQALLVALQERLLHKKLMIRMSSMLPPLQVMETLLFQIVAIGFGLLTIVLVSSFISFSEFYAAGVLHKTLLAVLAWLVFAVLLLGRFLWGWRGYLAANYTLLGVILLMFSYFGSKVLVEMLL